MRIYLTRIKRVFIHRFCFYTPWKWPWKKRPNVFHHGCGDWFGESFRIGWYWIGYDVKHIFPYAHHLSGSMQDSRYLSQWWLYHRKGYVPGPVRFFRSQIYTGDYDYL